MKIDSLHCDPLKSFINHKSIVYKVLPGNRKFELTYSWASAIGNSVNQEFDPNWNTIIVDIQPGHNYRVDFMKFNERIIYWIIDKETGEKYFDETTKILMNK
jgi:hypothetical protein